MHGTLLAEKLGHHDAPLWRMLPFVVAVVVVNSTKESGKRLEILVT